MMPHEREQAERQADKEAVENWLDAKCPKRPPSCPSCGQKDWTVGQPSVLVPVKNGNVRQPTPELPFVPLICGHCGHTQFYLAKDMGLIALAPGTLTPHIP